MEKAEAPVHICIPWLWPHITPTSASTIKSASLPPLPCKDSCDYIRPTQIIQDSLPSQNSSFNQAGTFCQVRSRNHRFCGLGLGQIWGHYSVHFTWASHFPSLASFSHLQIVSLWQNALQGPFVVWLVEPF